MEENKEEWIKETMASLAGMKRAQPAKDLFAKIETEVNQTQTKIVPMSRWRPAVAAAIVILVLNIFAIKLYTQRNISVATEEGVELAYESQLISDFKLYDE